MFYIGRMSLMIISYSISAQCWSILIRIVLMNKLTHYSISGCAVLNDGLVFEYSQLSLFSMVCSIKLLPTLN